MLIASLTHSIFPEVVAEVLADYPSIAQLLEIYGERPPFSSTYRPQKVNLYFDDCWVASWNSLGAVNQIPELPSNCRPEVVELEVDDEPGLILVNGVVVLNRVEQIPGRHLWLVQDVPVAA
jgi:hypothetical protein